MNALERSISVETKDFLQRVKCKPVFDSPSLTAAESCDRSKAVLTETLREFTDDKRTTKQRYSCVQVHPDIDIGPVFAMSLYYRRIPSPLRFPLNALHIHVVLLGKVVKDSPTSIGSDTDARPGFLPHATVLCNNYKTRHANDQMKSKPAGA